jgi:hypothetical protein
MVDVTAYKLTWFESMMVSLVTLVVCCYGIAPRAFGMTLRPEKLLILVAFVILLAVVILRGGRFRISKAEAFLAGWLGLSVVSSLLSQNPGAALKHTFDLGISVAIFFIASSWRLERILLTSSQPILRVGVFLGMSSIAVGFVLLSGKLPDFPFLDKFVMTEIYANLVRIKMTMWEANLFGAVMMVFALLSIAEFRKNSLYSWVNLIATHAGVLLAFSRGPFIGYLIGMFLYSHYLDYKWLKRLMFAGIVTAGILTIIALTGSSLQPYDSHALLRSSTLMVRVVSVQVALQDIMSAPLFGNGTYSFGFMHPDLAIDFGASEEVAAWISVLPVALLHDTGIIGFLLFAWFFAVILGAARKALVKAMSLNLDKIFLRRVSVWFGASIGMLLLSLTTSAYSLASFWLVMAVVARIPKGTEDYLFGLKAQSEDL